MSVRNDLRKNEAIRELGCELGLISESTGSCRLQQGKTNIILIENIY